MKTLKLSVDDKFSFFHKNCNFKYLLILLDNFPGNKCTFALLESIGRQEMQVQICKIHIMARYDLKIVFWMDNTFYLIFLQIFLCFFVIWVHIHHICFAWLIWRRSTFPAPLPPTSIWRNCNKLSGQLFEPIFGP